MKITIKPQFYSKELKHVELDTLINMTKGGFAATTIQQLRAATTKEQKKEIKNRLPIFYMGAYSDLTGGVGREKDMTHTGIMVFDLDGLEAGQATTIRNHLVSTLIKPFVSFAFISPSGGLKFGINTSFTGQDNDFHKYCYKRLTTLLVKLGLPEQNIDVSTCNFNRGTYLSHDPECYYNQTPATFSLDRWCEEYQAERKAEIEKQKRDMEYAKFGTVDADHATASMEKAFQTIVGKMGNGNRHGLIYVVCAACYERGMTEVDAEQYLNRLAAMGHYTETMSTRSKAQDSYKSWKSSGGYVKREFIKQTKESKAAYTASAIANIFAGAAA